MGIHKLKTIKRIEIAPINELNERLNSSRDWSKSSDRFYLILREKLSESGSVFNYFDRHTNYNWDWLDFSAESIQFSQQILLWKEEEKNLRDF